MLLTMKTAATDYRIILIDDHCIVRMGIRSLLETQEDLKVIAEAGGRREALDAIETECPDLAIVDLMLGSDDGISFIKECRAQYAKMKILVMTVHDENVYAERVFRAGADGFIAKESSTRHLLEAVRTVLNGEIYLSRASSSRILGRVFRGSENPHESPLEVLSDRELHVFQMIGTGMSTKEIATSLSLSGKTIETYREKIKAKLSIPNAFKLREKATKWINEKEL